MDKRVYFLMVISFVIGMVELIINGIIDLIAEDFNVPLSWVGLLITVFSLIFAVASPILLVVTGHIERKRLILSSLYIFLFGSLLTVFSPTFFILFLARIILALSGALLIILCIVLAPTLVDETHKGRAIGIVSMGVSASLVLGVPIGLVLGDSFGWRAPFVLITLLTILSILGVHLFMERSKPRPPVPLKELWGGLKSKKILLAHGATLLYMTGHTAMYAYFKPYLEEMTSLSPTWINIVYFLFGAFAVFGGGFGGTMADKFGSKKTILLLIGIFSGVFFILPATIPFLPIFLLTVMGWAMLSWAISPAMQSYLIETDPKSGDIQQSLSNSSLHLGVALGSLIGGYVVDHFSVPSNSWVGGILIGVSFLFAFLSSRLKYEKWGKVMERTAP